MTPTIEMTSLTDYMPLIFQKYVLRAIGAENPTYQPCTRTMTYEVEQLIYPDMLVQARVTHGDDVWTGTILKDGREWHDLMAALAKRVAEWHEIDIHGFEYAGN